MSALRLSPDHLERLAEAGAVTLGVVTVPDADDGYARALEAFTDDDDASDPTTTIAPVTPTAAKAVRAASRLGGIDIGVGVSVTPTAAIGNLSDPWPAPPRPRYRRTPRARRARPGVRRRPRRAPARGSDRGDPGSSDSPGPLDADQFRRKIEQLEREADELVAELREHLRREDHGEDQ